MFILVFCVYILLSSWIYVSSEVSTVYREDQPRRNGNSIVLVPATEPPYVLITQCIFPSKIFNVKLCYLIVILPSAASWQNRFFIKANKVHPAEITQPRLHCYANGGGRFEPERYFRTLTRWTRGQLGSFKSFTSRVAFIPKRISVGHIRYSLSVCNSHCINNFG